MSAAPKLRVSAAAYTAATSSSTPAVAAEFGFLGGETPSTSHIATGAIRHLVADGRIPPEIESFIFDLADPNRREHALIQLTEYVQVPDLARFIWSSSGTVAILLQEILSIYPLLSPPKPTKLTLDQSKRVCHSLALLQCVAAHPDTKCAFLKAYIPYYLMPFLTSTCETEQAEYLRLASLGVIGALVKVQDTNVIVFLLNSEIMPLFLRSMERGVPLSKTVATFIVQKILLDDLGLEYVCSTPERLFAVNQALGNVVTFLVEQPLTNGQNLLRLVIRCYYCLSKDERSRWTLRNFFPRSLAEGAFNHFLSEDATARSWLQQFLDNVLERPTV